VTSHERGSAAFKFPFFWEMLESQSNVNYFNHTGLCPIMCPRSEEPAETRKPINLGFAPGSHFVGILRM
jgi:hypothetical protein